MSRQRNSRSIATSASRRRTGVIGRMRVGQFEPLELRTMLTVSPGTPSTGAPTQNVSNAFDVNHDGRITPLDALAVINYLDSKTSSAAGNSVQAAAQSSGTQSPALDVNGDGLVSPLDALKVINALNSNDLAQITLVPVDDNGVPLSSIPVGSTFNLEAFGADISGAASPYIGTTTPPNVAGGVFEAEINAAYNSALVSIDPNATVTYGSNYTNAQVSDLSTPGAIVGTGAFASLTPLGPGQIELWSIPVTATAAGVQTFTPGPGTNSGNEILIYGSNTAVPPSQVDFEPGSITIVPAAAPVFSISPATVVRPTSGTTPEVFTVTLTNPTASPASVNFDTSDGAPRPGVTFFNGNAQAGTDYTATNGTLNFPVGTTTQNITVSVIGSPAYNPNSTFNVNLSAPTNASIGTKLAIGTITSTNAKPVLAVTSPPAVTRPTTGTANEVFTVTLAGPTELYAAVNYSTTNGTAIAGTDYTATSGQLVFLPGATSETITVPILGNVATTGSVSFTLNLKVPTNATIQSGSGVATGSIIDSVATPSFTVNDVTVPEVFPASVTTNAVFTVALGAPLAQQATVAYTTADGTATAANGAYVPTSGILTFAPGVVTQPVTVIVKGNTLPQPATSFFLNLSNPTGGSSIADSQGVATIAPPALTIDDVSQTIASSGITNYVFAVTLTGAVPDQVTVGYATANQTAIAGTDYVPQSGNLTFTPGQTVQTITVPVFGSAVFSPDKTFLVNLSSATGGVGIARAQGIGTIHNPNVNGLTVGNITVLQPTSGTVNAVFTVILPTATSQQVTVQYATADGTAHAPTDYTSTAGTLTFAPNVTSQQVTVVVNGNAATHPNETFTLNLTNPVNAIIATSQATATIENAGSNTNDEAQIRLVVVDPTTLAPITTPLAAGQAFDVEAFVKDLRTTEPAADMGVAAAYLNVSYQANLAIPTGGINFASNYTNIESGDLSTPGSFSEIGAFESSPGNTPLGPSEQLLFTVPMVAQGAGILTFTALPAQVHPQHDVLLFTQDTPVPIDQVLYVSSNVVDVGANSFSINNVTQVDTAAGTDFVFTVTRIVPDPTVATVQFATANGTAVAGTDYTATSGTLTFPVGTTTENLTVHVLGSTEDQPSKTFLVNLTNPVNATIGTSPGTGTIQYNNPSPTATIANAAANEGQPVVFTVSLSAASGFPITINYATANGTATAGVNYTATSGVLTIPAGSRTGTITVPTIATLSQVGSLTFTVQLSGATHVTLGNTTATGTINFVQPSGISGFVYVDVNANGIKDNGELGIQGVTITVNSTATDASGKPLFTKSTVTAADGSYTFIGLQPGTYNVIETQPGFFVTGAPTSNEFMNVVLVAGQAVSNENFAELGLRAQFVAAFSNRRAFLASTETTGFIGLPQGTQNADLTQGDVWVSFDNGWQNARKFEALFNSAQGTATLTLYDNNLNVIATSTPEAAGAVLIGNATLGSPYFLKISGSNTDVSLKITESATASSPSVAKSGSSITPMVFTVTLSAPTTSTATVAYVTADGTAVAGTDYTAETGTLTFAPGVTSQNVTVPILASTLFGPSETFSLKLSNPVGVFVNPPGTGTGTILNNNPPPAMSIADTNVLDPSTGTVNAVFAVSLSAPSGLQTTVAYATAKGTAPASDFVATSGTLTFAPGTVTQNITVAVRADSSLTAAETFLIKLTNPVGAILVKNQGTGTINPAVSPAVMSAVMPLVQSSSATPAVSSTLFATTTAVSTSGASTASTTLGRGSLFSSSAPTSSQKQATDQALADDETWAYAGIVV